MGVGSSSIDINLDATILGIPISAGAEDISTAKLKAGVNYEASESLDVYGELWGQGFDDFTIGFYEYSNITASGVSLGFRVKL